MGKTKAIEKQRANTPARAEGRCLCGAVVVEIAAPAQWAWHDHSPSTRRAHGAAYATYVGSWASRFRYLKGEDNLTHYDDKERGGVRSFCSTCGSPITFQRLMARPVAKQCIDCKTEAEQLERPKGGSANFL